MKFSFYSFLIMGTLLLSGALSSQVALASQKPLQLGVAPASGSIFSSADAAQRFGGLLGHALDEDVSVRLFDEARLLPEWLHRFRAVDLSLLPSEVLQDQAAGKFHHLHSLATGEVFVMRQGIAPARREEIENALKEMLAAEKLADVKVEQIFSSLEKETPHQAEPLASAPPPEVRSVAGKASELTPQQDEQRRKAVMQARSGDLPEALTVLSGLHAQAPDNARLTYDYLAVLGWAEQDAGVVILSDGLALDQAPRYVVETVAKARRNQKWFEASAALYQDAMQRWPEHLPFALGRLLALADAGEVEKGRDLAHSLRARHPGRQDVLSACLYAAERAGDHLNALELQQRLLEMSPDDPALLRGRIRSLEKLGASHLAMSYALQSPELLTLRDLMRLRNDMAAHRVRWGSLSTEPGQDRFAETDQALTAITRNLNRFKTMDEAQPDLARQARIDQLVALRDRVQMAEATAVYQSLSQEQENLPGYGLKAAGDAYLYLEEPEQARDLYRKALQLDPYDFDAQIALFYAYVEMEDFERALAHIDRLRARKAAAKAGGGLRVRPDHDRLTAEVTAALARMFARDLPEAQTRIEALHDTAPLNLDLKRELGGVYAARGWPRRSETILEAGLLHNDEHRGLRIARAHNHFDLREYALAAEATEELYELYPENKQVQHLEQRRHIHTLREIWVEAGYSYGSDIDPGGDELRLSTTLYSSPIRENYRLFGGLTWSRGDFPEGRGVYRRYRSGVEYRGREFEGTAEVHYTAAGADSPGLAATGNWHHDDHWSFPFAVEIGSRDTPLRALRNGVDADSARLGVVRRVHERRRWSWGAGIMDFSDGNLRTHLNADVRQRLVTRPHYQLDAVVDLYGSFNKHSDVPYYSPEQDASASLTLDNNWLLWRRYQRALRQRLAVTLGGYQQKGYGTGPLYSVLYEHQWEVDGRFNLVYGAGWHRRVYDGDPENVLDSHLRIRWRF